MNAMMNWLKRLMRNHKGFSLVELMCTVAIFSVVLTGLGSAMVISARSYQNSNVELDLQQQAQITANLLTNLIIDANLVEEPSDATGGTLLKIKKEEMVSGTPVSVSYEVTYDSTNKQLLYSKDGGASQVLAENIADFSIKRVAANNFDFSLKIGEEGGRTYESDYHVTPRNGANEDTNSALAGVKGLYVENILVLEPGQVYDLAVRVTGTSNQDYEIQNLSGKVSSDTDVTHVDSRTAQIKVGLTETGTGTDACFTFDVVPKDSSVATINVKVLIRRVKDIRVNGYNTGGTAYRAGAEYKVSAVLAVDNPEKKPGQWFDVDYVDPYTNKWEFEFTDDSGNKWHPGNNEFNEYIQITGHGTDSGNIPYVTFKLKRDMTAGCSIEVTGTALHPEGVNPDDATNMTNKSGLHYGKLANTTLSVSDSWTLKQQAWKRNGKLDIAIHHLGDENFWDYDGQIMYKWDASVKFFAYDSAGNRLPVIEGDFDPWQRAQHLPIRADIDLNNIRDHWDLILMPYQESNNVWDWGPSYSLPYIVAYYNNPVFDRNYYLWQAGPYFINTKLGVAGYNIELTYQYMDESGVLQTETINENYEVEEVSVLYRNALDAGCSWQRDNRIFVTTADTITDYKVHFQFDRGWDEDDHDYHFIDLKRFVGVVADRPGYVNDIRRDITVTGNEVKKAVPDGDSVLTFTLTAADKAECKALADAADGTISMIYEYNPFLGRLQLKEKSEAELLAENPSWADNFWAHYNTEIPADPLNPRWYKEYDMPLDVRGVTVTQEMMDRIKGCEGKVIFCFKDPNITGATLKTMYCPTITEYGPLYYIDDTSRFVIAAGAAQYQELVGGTWTTIVNLTWNGSGWTAN